MGIFNELLKIVNKLISMRVELLEFLKSHFFFFKVGNLFKDALKSEIGSIE
jgi:hypothetical protein